MLRRLTVLLAFLAALAAWPEALAEGASASDLTTATPETVFHVPVTPDESDDITDEQRRELERIATLGYVAAGDRAPDYEGVTVHDPTAYEGYTIFVSRDHPGAFLVDMRGRVLHYWVDDGPQEWARAWVYPDGSILGISAHPGRLARLDRDSRLIWTYGGDGLNPHHDFCVQPDGTIYVLMRRARVFPWLRDGVIQDDTVSVLEPDGGAVREVERISIPEAFHASDHAYVLFGPQFGDGADPLHTNSIEVLDGRVEHPAFCSGNVLISMRNIDCLAVLNPRSREIVWVNQGRWQRQHEARITPDGHILLFDNRKFDGQSRVVEYDVVSDEIVWSYTKPGFFSRGSGAQQLLPNGNVLITESQKGRIFEVDREGRVVWDYTNPRRVHEGQRIARITRAYRVDHDYFTGPFSEYLAEQEQGD